MRAFSVQVFSDSEGLRVWSFWWGVGSGLRVRWRGQTIVLWLFRLRDVWDLCGVLGIFIILTMPQNIPTPNTLETSNPKPKAPKLLHNLHYGIPSLNSLIKLKP